MISQALDSDEPVRLLICKESILTASTLLDVKRRDYRRRFEREW